MGDTERPIIDRHAARVLLLDRDDRLLLFHCQEPGASRSFWITPGGGLEDGETHEQATLRELYEETGLSNVKPGPCVWTRTHTFPWLGKTYRQHERFFLLRVDSHIIDPVGHTEEERQVLTDHRWWSAGQIATARDESFAPRQLGQHLTNLLKSPPTHPIDVGA